MHCKKNMKKGWRCIRTHHDSGPCALVPRWWNLRDKIKYRHYIY